jgi:hypothetical protein
MIQHRFSATTFQKRTPLSLSQWASLLALLAFVVSLVSFACIPAQKVLLVVLGLYALILSWYWPLPVLVVAMILSTTVFQLVSLEHLPYLQLTGDTRLNALDVCILVSFCTGLLRMIQRKRIPLFLFPLAAIIGAMLLALLVGVIRGTTSLSSGLNGMRAVSGFLFYFCLAGNITTRRQLKWIIFCVFLFMLVSVGIQGYESIQGQRLITPFVSSNAYWSTTKWIRIGNEQVPYLWNRAPLFLALGFFMAWGALLSRYKTWPNALLFAAACIGYFITLTRSWYVLIAVGLAASLMFSARRPASLFKGLLIAMLLLFLVGISLVIFNQVGLDLKSVWWSRVSTILDYQNEATFQIRIMASQKMWQLFLKSPFSGHGPGSGFYNTDLGMWKSLVEYGALGWLAVMYLGAAVLRRLLALIQTTAEGSREHGYALGLLGLWIGLYVLYFFSIDPFFYTSLSIGIGVLLAICEKMPSLAGERRFSAV